MIDYFSMMMNKENQELSSPVENIDTMRKDDSKFLKNQQLDFIEEDVEHGGISRPAYQPINEELLHSISAKTS